MNQTMWASAHAIEHLVHDSVALELSALQQAVNHKLKALEDKVSKLEQQQQQAPVVTVTATQAE